jgi:hypothetical protein
MSRKRKFNDPLEVWTTGDAVYQVLKKDGEWWIVATSTPRDLDTKGQKALGSSIENACDCVWRESDGKPLPEEYRFDVTG